MTSFDSWHIHERKLAELNFVVEQLAMLCIQYHEKLLKQTILGIFYINTSLQTLLINSLLFYKQWPKSFL